MRFLLACLTLALSVTLFGCITVGPAATPTPTGGTGEVVIGGNIPRPPPVPFKQKGMQLPFRGEVPKELEGIVELHYNYRVGYEYWDWESVEAIKNVGSRPFKIKEARIGYVFKDGAGNDNFRQYATAKDAILDKAGNVVGGGYTIQSKVIRPGETGELMGITASSGTYHDKTDEILMTIEPVLTYMVIEYTK